MDEKHQSLKGKIEELEKKVRQLNEHKFILINILNEANKGKNIKLDNLLYGIDISEDISYLNDWAEFHLKQIKRCEARLNKISQSFSEKILDKRAKGIVEKKHEDKFKDELKQETPELTTKSIEDSFKLIFKETKDKKQIPITEKKPGFVKWLDFEPKTFVKYSFAFAVLLLVISGLFLLKPSITGLVVSGEEKTYEDYLSLKINESGNYTWDVKNPGNIKSIRATGSVEGNGTVKIYIEKDEKRYLIFDNKQSK